VADGLTSFIQTWLVDHVNNFDREFVGHILNKSNNPHATHMKRKPHNKKPGRYGHRPRAAPTAMQAHKTHWSARA
jgi:hypothetical protein